MRPPGNSGIAHRSRQGEQPGEQLRNEPKTDIEQRRNIDKPGKDKNRDQGGHLGAREKHKIRPEYGGNRSAGSDRGTSAAPKNIATIRR